MKKITCFIATAFDRPDVDKVYDKVVLPVLRSKDIVARRIDRIQHNDDVTTRIIKEINSADFCIVDLTYARPSVYYEAGYAERNIPVIYIVRKDHFKHKTEDEFGNLSVHFDVKVKNIIPWISHYDTAFQKKLKDRIEYVIKPISRTFQGSKDLERERMIFSSLALYEKVLYCREQLEGFFRKYKFYNFPQVINVNRYGPRKEEKHRYLVKGNTGFYSDSLVFWKPSKGLLRLIGSRYTRWYGVDDIYKTILRKRRKKISGLIYFGVIVSPNKISAGKISEALTGYRNAAYQDLKYFFVDVNKEPIEISKNKTIKLKITSLFIVVDNIQSKQELLSKYKQLFDFVVDQSDKIILGKPRQV